MRVFRSPSPPPTCFFCLSTLSHVPRNPESFKCPFCLCWNRYDKNGEILSDEPAMRDDSLNAASFAKKASPSKHRLPTAYAKGPFCHTCETNQMLLMNMLSNHLPSPEDPTYDTRVAGLPEYTASLQARYPPVCKDCQPAVDEELQKKEHMARTTALGGWLKQSQHVGTKRPVETQRGKRDVLTWKVRAILWFQTVALYMVIDILGFLEYDLARHWLCLMLLPFSLLSILWTFWDPTWLAARQARLQGRTVRVSGRENYIRCQMIAWLSRFVTSSLTVLHWTNVLASHISAKHSGAWYITAFFIETAVSLFSWFTLRIQQPPTIRLLEPKLPKPELSYAPPVPDSEPLIASLSLSNQPPSNSANPVFGQPSFPQVMAVPDVSPEDVMDWAPINGTPERVQDRENWMRPQRFFPPEQPTGLEDLFQKTKLDVQEHGTEKKLGRAPKEDERRKEEWREFRLILATAIGVALAAAITIFWFQHLGRGRDVTFVTLE